MPITLFPDSGKGFTIGLGSNPDLGTFHKTEEDHSSFARAVKVRSCEHREGGQMFITCRIMVISKHSIGTSMILFLILFVRGWQGQVTTLK